jgi:formylmethanofuran dehydrogenase subunit E
MDNITCDLCGEIIFPEDAYYHMPDGLNVCEDCLSDWADEYKLRA